MRVPSRSAARRPGMSLLEVLVALAIFIMTLAALGQLVQVGMEQADDADNQTVTARLALSKMGEVEAGLIDVATGDAGQFDEQETLADGAARWKWEVLGTATAVPNVYEVTVTVSSVTGNSYSYSLSQLIFDPLYQGTAAPAVDPNAAAAATTGGMSP